jgi:exodeoxyribonuclease VII small subunit
MTQESEKGGLEARSSKAGSFERSFQKLEETVRRLEAGQLTLDEATRLFEEGMKLAKQCSELLSTAELKITRLQSGFAEQMNLVPEDGTAGDDAEDEE